MVNPIEDYFMIGQAVARARNEWDEARAVFHMNHLRKMLNVETREARPECRAAYDAGFNDARNVPPVEYFR